MICRGYNAHITELLMNQQVLWKLILDDNTEIWSDFDLPDHKDPWTRAKQYCSNNKKDIVKVIIIPPGQPEIQVFQDDKGLDNIFLMRGTAKDINDTGESIYSFVTFGKLEEDGLIHVRRFYWPECAFGTSEEIRELTPENEKLLFKKRNRCGDSCQCQNDKQI